jgi:hypothetical protein
MMDLSKVTEIEFGDVDHNDYPDYSDAHIVSANYDGIEMNDKQLDELNEYKDFVYESLMENLIIIDDPLN